MTPPSALWCPWSVQHRFVLTLPLSSNSGAPPAPHLRVPREAAEDARQTLVLEGLEEVVPELQMGRVVQGALQGRDLVQQLADAAEGKEAVAEDVLQGTDAAEEVVVLQGPRGCVRGVLGHQEAHDVAAVRQQPLALPVTHRSVRLMEAAARGKAVAMRQVKQNTSRSKIICTKSPPPYLPLPPPPPPSPGYMPCGMRYYPPQGGPSCTRSTSTPARERMPPRGRGLPPASLCGRGGSAAGCRSSFTRPDPGVQAPGRRPLEP